MMMAKPIIENLTILFIDDVSPDEQRVYQLALLVSV